MRLPYVRVLTFFTNGALNGMIGSTGICYFVETPGGSAFARGGDGHMLPDKQRVQQYLKASDFTTLFREELGWDTLKEAPLAIPVDGQIYTLRPLMEKRGFKVYLSSPTTQGQITASSGIRQIEREVT